MLLKGCRDMGTGRWAAGGLAAGMLFVLCGCQTVGVPQGKSESPADVQRAVTSMTGAIAGRRLTPEEVQQLEVQMKTDKEAQSAIQAISNSVGKATARAKYCPVDGAHFAPNLEECPIHHVPLKTVGGALSAEGGK